MRILAISSSEREYRESTTGVGSARHFLFEQLSRCFPTVDTFQPYPTTADALLGRVLTWREDRAAHERAYKRHHVVFESKARAFDRYLQRLSTRPDLVFQWEFLFCPFAGDAPRVPYVVYNDWSAALSRREYPERARIDFSDRFLAMQRKLVTNASFVFCFSEKVRASVVNDYGVDPSRAILTYGGANLAKIPAPIERDGTARKLLFIGNDYRPKGLPTLLEAFRSARSRMPTLTLTVVGNPGEFGEPEEPGVTYRGSISDKGLLDELYRSADIFVLPTKIEAFGHVFTEAMCYSLPCIGSNVGAIAEIIEDQETGYVINPTDHAALSDRLLELAKSPPLCRRMGAAGYRRATTLFTWKSVVDAMQPYIEEAAS